MNEYNVTIYEVYSYSCIVEASSKKEAKRKADAAKIEALNNRKYEYTLRSKIEKLNDLRSKIEKVLSSTCSSRCMDDEEDRRATVEALLKELS